MYDRRRKAWVDAPPSTTTILLVNKQVSPEATLVFYGSNDFFFENAGALRDFLAWIGHSKQHLCHIEINGQGILFNTPWTAMDHSLGLLKASKGLRALHFYHNGFCSGNNDGAGIGDVAAHCSLLLKSLQATWDARNVKMNVLDIVKVVLPPCHCTLCPEPKKQCQYHSCRGKSIHERRRSRWNTTPGGGPCGVSLRFCACDCEAAEDKNRSMNEELKNGIRKQLGLDTDYGDV